MINTYANQYSLRAFGLTLAIHFEHGKPLSREKAQISRDVVTKAVTLPEKMRMNRTTESSSATGVDPVLVNKMRYGASESMAVSRSPMQKSIVMSIIVPMKALTR
jgi:hypothetical protein